jgi:glycine cleavage system H protein
MTLEEPTVSTQDLDVEGYALRLDRAYHQPTHLWMQQVGARVRIGLDALTADTYGMLAQLVLPAPGDPMVSGTPFGSLEAAKFVGPLVSPCDGTVAAVNGAVLDDPELVMREPYDGGWLVELTRPTEAPLADTVSGDAAVEWYRSSVAEHRDKGLVAE